MRMYYSHVASIRGMRTCYTHVQETVQEAHYPEHGMDNTPRLVIEQCAEQIYCTIQYCMLHNVPKSLFAEHSTQQVPIEEVTTVQRVN